MQSEIDSLNQINTSISNEIQNINAKLVGIMDSNIVVSNLGRANDQSLRSIEIQLKSLNKRLVKQRKESLKLDNDMKSHIQRIEKNLESTDLILSATRDSLGMQVIELTGTISNTKVLAEAGIAEVNADLQTRSKYWIVAAVGLLLIVITVFFLLRYKVSSNTKTMSDEISRTRKNLQDQTLKVDADLLKLWEAQLSSEKEIPRDENSNNHILPIKLADEIHKMRKRLNTMDENQGVKVLSRRIESLEEALNKLGYEIKKLEGIPFIDGMNVEAHFITDESIAANEQIITRVIRPQVNYNDKLIQAAEVEVSQSN